MAWILIVGLVIILGGIKTGVFPWLADFLIDPGSKVPDPGQIDLPGVK